MSEVKELPTASYSITVEDFAGPKPESPVTKFSIEDKITRDNFTAFLIDSFSKSRGVFLAQMAYMSWLRKNSGFDYVSTLDNFRDQGGTDGLSKAERALIQRAYGVVKGHGDQLESDSLLKYRMDRQVSRVVDNREYWRDKVNNVFPDGLTGLTKDELMIGLDVLVKEYRAEEARQEEAALTTVS